MFVHSFIRNLHDLENIWVKSSTDSSSNAEKLHGGLVLQCGEQQVQLGGVHMLRTPSSEPCGLSYGDEKSGLYSIPQSLFQLHPRLYFSDGCGCFL